MADAIANNKRPWQRASVWLMFLGPFFFLSYGFANWLAEQQSSVDSIVFTWEHHIPFMPWTILPYWVIDLLYSWIISDIIRLWVNLLNFLSLFGFLSF